MAEHYYYQLPDENFYQEASLLLKNNSKQDSFVDVFLMNSETAPQKLRLALKGLESLKIEVKKIFPSEDSMAYLFVDISNKNGVSAAIEYESIRLALASQTGVEYKDLKAQKLKLHNFSAMPSTFKVFDNNNQQIDQIKVKAYSTLKIELKNQGSKILSDQPSLISQTIEESWQFLTPANYQLQKKKNAAYFLVSSRADHRYSFVIELKDPRKIKDARKYLEEDDKNHFHIVNGKITKNDLSNIQSGLDNKTAWSWKLSDIEFASFGGSFCNLHSLEIEINLKKLLEIDARSCNWQFRILKEL